MGELIADSTLGKDWLGEALIVGNMSVTMTWQDERLAVSYTWIPASVDERGAATNSTDYAYDEAIQRPCFIGHESTDYSGEVIVCHLSATELRVYGSVWTKRWGPSAVCSMYTFAR